MSFSIKRSVWRAIRSVGKPALEPLEAQLEAIREQAAQQAAQQAESLRSQFESERIQIESLRVEISALQKREDEILAVLNSVQKRRLPIGPDEYARLNPEVGLAAYLYSYLPCRVALDIGANIGDHSERFLQAGYCVYAFEPMPPVFEKLKTRLGSRADFHAAQYALGSEDRTMKLHLAADHSGGKYDDSTLYSSLLPHTMLNDLVFEKSVEVPVRSLDSLHRAGEIPAEVGFVKIDTEGYELPVMKGFGARKYSVVLAEFWDAKFPFSDETTCNRLDDMAAEMRAQGYHWFLTFYRAGSSTDVTFFCNDPRSPENSWGNVCFFQDFSIFERARDWCTACLPEAIARP